MDLHLGWVRLDPGLVAEISEDMETIRGDGEVPGVNPAEIKLVQAFGRGDGSGEPGGAFAEFGGGLIVPPKVKSCAEGFTVEPLETVEDQGVDHRAPDQTGTIDAKPVFAAPDVSHPLVTTQGGKVGVAQVCRVLCRDAGGKQENEGRERNDEEDDPGDATSPDEHQKACVGDGSHGEDASPGETGAHREYEECHEEGDCGDP